MRKKEAKKRLNRRLRRLRMIMYTTISLIVIETSGIFSLAKNGILYVQSNIITNAFAPQTYVDIDVDEKHGDTYYIEGNHAVTENGNKKEAHITNPGSHNSKKPVVVRARIIAVICDKDGIAKGTIQEFNLNGGTIATDATQENSWYKDTSSEYYYYTSVLEPGKSSSSIFTDVEISNTNDIPTGGYVTLHVIADTIEVDMTGTTESIDKNKQKITENWHQPATLWSDIF